jgi:DNA-directed RNA polymerase specialized sigma24 family protein
VVAGSLTDWHRLIARYTPLLLSVLRRHLHNEDDVRTVFAQVLCRLHDGKLATYEGRSALSTWLVLVARTEVFDFLRHRHGRRETPKGVDGLGEEDRRIFTLYFTEGWSLEGVRHRLASLGSPLSGAEVLAALTRIEAVLGKRALRRLNYDLSAASTSAASGRLLEFLDHAREEFPRASERWRADFELMEKETRVLATRAEALVETLPAEERAVLRLRFGRGLTARRVAKELGLSGPRRVYTLIEKSLRTLRDRLALDTTSPPG